MKLIHKPEKESFLLEENGEIIGELEYYIESDTLDIESVYVSPSSRGHGFGKYLVEQTIQYAAERDLKIHPMCSFARTILLNLKQFSKYRFDIKF